MRGFRVGRALLLASVLAGCGAGAPPRAPSERGDRLITVAGTPIALRSSMVADEYFWLRTKVLEGDSPPAFAEAFNAMHELRGDLAGDATAYEDQIGRAHV